MLRAKPKTESKALLKGSESSTDSTRHPSFTPLATTQEDYHGLKKHRPSN